MKCAKESERNAVNFLWNVTQGKFFMSFSVLKHGFQPIIARVMIALANDYFLVLFLSK